MQQGHSIGYQPEHHNAATEKLLTAGALTVAMLTLLALTLVRDEFFLVMLTLLALTLVRDEFLIVCHFC